MQLLEMSDSLNKTDAERLTRENNYANSDVNWKKIKHSCYRIAK